MEEVFGLDISIYLYVYIICIYINVCVFLCYREIYGLANNFSDPWVG